MHRSTGSTIPPEFHAGAAERAGTLARLAACGARSQRINYKDIAMLAHRFGVSYQAALYRLKSLRHIAHAESRDLLEQEEFGRQLLRELSMVGDFEESEHRDRELRSEIAHLAIEAYRREEIFRGRVLELSKTLGMKGDVLLRLAEAARGE